MFWHLLSSFLVKYLGLLAMGKILKTHPKSVQSHKDLILDCLDDKDESIRLRALDLLYGMVCNRFHFYSLKPFKFRCGILPTRIWLQFFLDSLDDFVAPKTFEFEKQIMHESILRYLGVGACLWMLRPEILVVLAVTSLSNSIFFLNTVCCNFLNKTFYSDKTLIWF